MADVATTTDASDEDVKQVIELLKQLLAALQKKRCQDKIEITRSATETGKGTGTTTEAEAAKDALVNKLTDAATAKVTAYADNWCKKGKCKDGSCMPEIDFKTKVSEHGGAMPKGTGQEAYSFEVTVEATGQISCVCKSPD